MRVQARLIAFVYIYIYIYIYLGGLGLLTSQHEDEAHSFGVKDEAKCGASTLSVSNQEIGLLCSHGCTLSHCTRVVWVGRSFDPREGLSSCLLY